MFNQQYLLDPNSLRRSRYSVPVIRKISIEFNSPLIDSQQRPYLNKMLDQRKHEWLKLSNPLIQSGHTTQQEPVEERKVKPPSRSRGRSVIQFPQPLKQKIGFSPFRTINLQHQSQLRKGICSVKDVRPAFVTKRSNPLVKAEILFNRDQMDKIKQYNRQQFLNTLNNFEDLYKKRVVQVKIETSKIKHRTIKPKLKQLRILYNKQIQLTLNEALFSSNRIAYKPSIAQDCMVANLDNTLYFLGGRNATHLMPAYSLTESKWIQKQKVKQDELLEITGTQCHVYEGEILFYGGEIPLKNARSKNLSNRLAKYNLKTGHLRVIEAKNRQIVSHRRCHSSTIVDNYLLVFGGIDSDYHYLNDLYILNLKTYEWSRIAYSCENQIKEYLSKGIARFKMITLLHHRHQGFKMNNGSAFDEENDYISQEGVYLYGGLNQSGSSLDKLLIIDLTTSRIYQPYTAGTRPSPVNDYAMTVHLHCLILHGGRNDSQLKHIRKGLYVLNLKTMNWTQIKLKYGFDRYGHEMGLYGNTLWIMGGKDLNGMNKDLVEWTINFV